MCDGDIESNRRTSTRSNFDANDDRPYVHTDLRIEPNPFRHKHPHVPQQKASTALHRMYVMAATMLLVLYIYFFFLILFISFCVFFFFNRQQQKNEQYQHNIILNTSIVISPPLIQRHLRSPGLQVVVDPVTFLCNAVPRNDTQSRPPAGTKRRPSPCRRWCLVFSCYATPKARRVSMSGFVAPRY